MTKPLAYWATVEHHRWWLALDGPHLKSIEKNGLQPVIAARIARDYSVARSIGAIEQDGRGKNISGLAALVKAINAAQWPKELEERARCCKHIADQHRDACISARAHSPISAVTKLMWFVRPRGWTMFDKYARLGLIRRNNDAICFYKTLHAQGFGTKAAELTKAAKAQGLPLFGERIIDKFLLFRGASGEAAAGRGQDYFAAAREVNEHYLRLLDREVAERLKQLAGEVARAMPDDAFGWQTR